jgi:RHS repeat-associated protein
MVAALTGELRAQEECPLRPSGGPSELWGSGGPNAFWAAETTPDWAVSVTPDGASVQLPKNSNNRTYTFVVDNVGQCTDTYYIGVTYSGAVSYASVSPTNLFNVAPGGGGIVTVTYGVGSGVSGTITVTASGYSTDDGTLNVTTDNPQVAVTPDGATTATRIANTGGYGETFTITNTGNVGLAFGLTCTASGLTCSGTSIPSVSLWPTQSTTATAFYSTGGAGTGTLTLAAAGGGVSDVGSYNVPVVSYEVRVTPDGARSAQRLENTSGHVESFTIHNAGSVANTYTLSCAGSVNITCMGTSVPSVALNPGISTAVTATYNVGSTGNGTLTLTASGTNANDAGTYIVPVVNSVPQAPSVEVASVNSGAFSERDACLTVAAGSAAGTECGDLRIVHALPAVRTMNKARVPTLLYNSQLAHPYPLVAANVTLAPGAPLPDSVTGVFTINDVIRARRKWGTTEWLPGQTRRVVLGFDGLSDPSGVYSYTLEIRNWYPATSLPVTASSQLSVVNRSASAFGAGWWLAGLEQLDVSTKRWVGGDGSVRQYQSVAADVWAASAFDRPDTLKWNAALGRYVRYLPHGLQVQFDATGKHVATVNRLLHSTTFGYDGCGRLGTITLPSAGAGLVYSFNYTSPTDCTTKLANVTAPPAGAMTRIATLTVTGGRVTAINGPDTNTVLFAYDPGFANRITSRTDARGIATAYAFDSGGKVAKDSLPMGGGQPSIVQRHRPLESLGLTSAVDTALAYTLLDGPRTEVGDSTRFWLDRFGAPRRIVNALGNETLIKREHATYPALATELRGLTGFVTRATYDSRANVKTATAVNPLGDGRDAVTRYEYTDAIWQDVPTRIVSPEGDSVVMAYDANSGNRVWQQDGAGPASRADFRYYDSGPCARLLKAVDLPASPPDSVAYDASLCNLSATWTPLRFRTDYHRDAVGRDTLIVSPIDSAQTKHQTQRSVYDVMDAVTEAVVSAPAINGAPAMLVRVQTSYDDEGNVLSVARRSEPDWNAIGWSTTTWTYDAAGRPIRETDPLGMRDSTIYDLAGNVIQRNGRANFINGMGYDALNRLIWRDDARFRYDAAGRLTSATNLHARITRSYYPAGGLQTDTLRIQTTAFTPVDSVWTGYTTHMYGLRYTYDLNGRRVGLKHPGTIRPQGPNVRDSVRYGYDPQHGGLAWIEGLGVNSRFDLHYNLDRQLDTLRMPAGIVEGRTYDGDGRPATRRTAASAGGWWGGGYLHDDSNRYDARGKITTATATWVGSHGISHGHLNFSTYDGIGTLILADHVGSAFWVGDETWQADALGNHVARQYVDPATSIAMDFEYTYEAASGRLRRMRTRVDTSVVADTLTYYHDFAGNQTGMRHAKKRQSNPYYPYGDLQFIVEVNTSYDHEQRLSETRRLSTQLLGAGLNRREEYRYDALGRRVWRRAINGWDMSGTVRDTLCTRPQPSNDCMSFVERTVWDGDQVLYEIRAPGGPTEPASTLEADQTAFGAHYGRVVYTPGLGIDQPLELVRLDYDGVIVTVPHADWRGTYDMVTFTGSEHATYGPAVGWPLGGSERYPIDFMSVSAFAEPSRHSDGTNVGPRSWFGNVLLGQQDASGLLHRRNRYYDPKQGRFTQEDPIGLAGGLNLYGFANSDPVNYADPFGLCSVATAVANLAMGAAIARLTGSGYGLGAAALDVASGCIGIGALRNAARLAKLSRAARTADNVADAASSGRRLLPFSDAGRLDEINKTLDRIEAGVHKYAQDGALFRNAEGKLPGRPAGYYREYTVDTRGAGNRGARRIVRGRNGETYYTDDHYNTFTQIDPHIY